MAAPARRPGESDTTMPLPSESANPVDGAAREREYSPSSVIGGHYAPFIDAYRSLSARALATVPVRRDLRYGPADRACLDFFPASVPTSQAGLLVFIHGGYWQELSKDESAFLAPAWHDAGFAHATVGYTLAPAATVPQIVEQCCSAIQWLYQRADDLGVDPNGIVVAGSSAGGYLAAACAARGTTPLRGIVPISGIFDVAPLMGTSINDALRLDEATARALDLLDASVRYPPAVVAWGEVETAAFKAQSRAFADLVGRSGTRSSALEVPGRNHFDVVHELGDRQSRLYAAVSALWRS
jgi:arylformamidase